VTLLEASKADAHELMTVLVAKVIEMYGPEAKGNLRVLVALSLVCRGIEIVDKEILRLYPDKADLTRALEEKVKA
jgi:hypothetical protein